MFLLLAIVSTIAYAVQSTLMASFYRSMDRLSAVAYRGLSLGITMLPLLLFAPTSTWIGCGSNVIVKILAASVLAAIGNRASASAYSSLPVGIAGALTMSFATICAAVVSYLLFDESLTTNQIIIVALILSGISALGMSKSTGALPKDYSVKQGVISSFIYGVTLGSAFTFVGSASRDIHPFAVGYMWEITIGIITLIAACSRRLFGKSGLQKLSVKDLGKLTLFSSPTVIGTACYALATSQGPIGIVTAIVATGMIWNSLLGMILYKERLSTTQWMIILFVCLTVGALRIF